ncbi:MAG: serine--tRNA ligase, partial [Opitutaceae bacterium]|nr:serine--tRNA ligase [Opitutaceae bacterium]
MLDPRILRETPDVVRAAIAKKHLVVDLAEVLALDTAWRTLLTEVEVLRSQQKAANNEMAAMPKGTPAFLAKVQEMKVISIEIKAKDESLKHTEEKLHTAMLSVPNLPHASVPEGRTPEDNQVFAT